MCIRDSYCFDKNPKKINVGFVSPDFRNHPVGYAMTNIIKNLKSYNFNLFGYYNFTFEDELTNKFKKDFDSFYNITDLTDEQVINKIRTDGIHILIDLAGYTFKNRLSIFFYNPAPIQISWLGYLPTTGIKEIKYKILFVCTGNICRSPSAEGVFKDIVKENSLSQFFYIDSCGTHAFHTGQSPDSRSQYAAMKRGIDISQQIARTIEQNDFNKFDYILAMDNYNLSFLQSMADESHLNKIHLFLEYDENCKSTEVPDPYYGGEDGFEIVLDLLQKASIGLIKHLKSLKT